MVAFAVVAVVSAAVGFGAGRVKNAAKLAAVKAEVAKVEGKLAPDFQAVVNKVKALV